MLSYMGTFRPHCHGFGRDLGCGSLGSAVRWGISTHSQLAIDVFTGESAFSHTRGTNLDENEVKC